MAVPRAQAGARPTPAPASARRLAKMMSIASNLASAGEPGMESQNMHLSFLSPGQEVWQDTDPIPRIGRMADIKKRPDGICRGRNSEYLFRRIYPM
jgi:hypothetical protein